MKHRIALPTLRPRCPECKRLMPACFEYRDGDQVEREFVCPTCEAKRGRKADDRKPAA